MLRPRGGAECLSCSRFDPITRELQCNRVRSLRGCSKAGPPFQTDRKNNERDAFPAYSYDEHEFEEMNRRNGSKSAIPQTPYRAPLDEQIKKRQRDRASDSKTLVDSLEVRQDGGEEIETPKRYMYLGSQVETETKVFDVRRLSGNTLVEPRGRFTFLERLGLSLPKPRKFLDRVKRRRGSFGKGTKPDEEAWFNRYSDAEMNEAEKRLARLALLREAEKKGRELTKERQDARKRMTRLREAEKVAKRLAKSQVLEDQRAGGW